MFYVGALVIYNSTYARSCSTSTYIHHFSSTNPGFWHYNSTLSIQKSYLFVRPISFVQFGEQTPFWCSVSGSMSTRSAVFRCPGLGLVLNKRSPYLSRHCQPQLLVPRLLYLWTGAYAWSYASPPTGRALIRNCNWSI